MRINHEISQVFIEQCKSRVYYRRLDLKRRRDWVVYSEGQLRQAQRELKKWSNIRAKQQRAKRRRKTQAKK
jgi:hypothetical protein